MKAERDESIRLKAELLLYKLYRMWSRFTLSDVDEFLEMATDEEISFYYYMICIRR